MSGTIEQAFVKQFEAEVAEAYQRQGSKLRPTVRSKTGVKGASTIFPRVGKGVAAAKARNGVVPVMNLEYSNAECFLHVAVIYAGKIVESGSKEDVFDRPAHPYTLGLFGSLPSVAVGEKRLHPIGGMPPDPTNLPPGCAFWPR